MVEQIIKEKYQVDKNVVKKDQKIDPVSVKKLSVQNSKNQSFKLVSPIPQPVPPKPKNNWNTSYLKPNAKFTGFQESGFSRYEVNVKLTEVNMEDSFISGFLTIYNLTDSNPTITTFFKGEIIGKHHSFITENPQWESNIRNDIQHWARFPSWRDLNINMNNDLSNNNYYNKSLSQTYIFMRWKELFLYPDATVKGIKGASFAGFYYICFNQSTGSFEGIYYHKYTDKFQQLNLSFIPDSGTRSIYQYA